MMVKRFLCLLTMVVMTFSVFVIGNGEGSEFRLRTDLSWSSVSFIGEDANDNAGIAIAGAGDVNGDGYDDLLIGASGDDDGGLEAGQAYLILGGKGEWAMDIDISTASASFWGEDAGDNAGRSVAGAGDVNGDGYDDILIGAPGDDDGGNNAGQTYLILGRSSGWSKDIDLSTASASFWGEFAADNSGRSICGAGDVNADGYDDILIGADNNDDGGSLAGQSYLILGKKTGWAMDTSLTSSSASFWGEDFNDLSGKSVAGAGDVNGDGYDDILIGAVGNAEGGFTFRGQTYLILGKQSGWAMDTDLSTASASFLGTNANDQSGFSVSGPGDVNGDGYCDIAIGANMNSDGGSGAGQVYLIFGKRSGWTMDASLSSSDASFIGEDPNDHLGDSVSGSGDTNNDGYDDLLIGSRDNDAGGSNAGQAYLIWGKAAGWSIGMDLSTADGSFIGESGSDKAGTTGHAGDVNGDGNDDIVISAIYNNDGGSQAGQTYLILSLTSPPGPQNLASTLTMDKPLIALSWDAPNEWAEPLHCYRIYRSTDGSDYLYLGWTGASTRTYVDSTVSVGSTYRYEVIADYDQGDNYLGKAMVSILCDIDTDSDGIGNMADWDDDDDNITDHSDAFPLDSKEWLDSDLDGEGNEVDKDDDNDGIEDTSDPNPLNPSDPLSIKLDALTLTIVSRFDSLEGDLAELEGNIEDDIMTSTVLTREDLTSIMDRLEDLNNTLELVSLSENLTIIRSMLDNDSKDALPTLFNLLSDIISHLESNLTELLEHIVTGQNASASRLNDLERSLGALEDLETIIDGLDRVQSDVDDTEKKVDSNNDLTLYLFILTIAVVCIIGVLLLVAVRSGGEKKGRPKNVEE